MDTISDRRLAENEVIFKQLNTEVKEFVLKDAPDSQYAQGKLRFYCECSNTACRERIVISASEYDSLHTNRKYFIIKPGHMFPEIENVIKHTAEYDVVEKKEVPPVPEDIDPKLFL